MLCTWRGCVIPQSLTPHSRGWRALRSTHGIECRTWVSELQTGAPSRMACVQRSTQTSKTLVQAALVGNVRPAKKPINSFFLNTAVSLPTLAPSSGRKVVLWLDFHSHAAPTSAHTRLDAQVFRVLLLRRLWLLLPLTQRTCQCGRLLDSLGHTVQRVRHSGSFGSQGVRLGVSSSPCVA